MSRPRTPENPRAVDLSKCSFVVLNNVEKAYLEEYLELKIAGPAAGLGDLSSLSAPLSMIAKGQGQGQGLGQGGVEKRGRSGSLANHTGGSFDNSADRDSDSAPHSRSGSRGRSRSTSVALPPIDGTCGCLTSFHALAPSITVLFRRPLPPVYFFIL